MFYIIGIIGIVIGLLIIGSWLRSLARMADRHGGAVLAWRWVTGADLDHGRSHDCPGPQCRARAWAHRPRHHRAAIRVATPAAALAAAYGMIADEAATVYSAAAAAVAVTLAAAWTGVRRRRQRRHDRRVIAPMAASLAAVIGTAPAQARAAVHLPHPGTDPRGHLGHIELPDAYPAGVDARKAVEHVISTHLPWDVDVSWRTAGKPKRVMISAAPKPPEVVPFASVMDEIARCAPGVILIGIDRHSDPFRWSLNDGDDPHGGFSVGSGRGKSTFLNISGAQILHQDPAATITGIDPKMSSFDPITGVPGVTLANDPRDIPGMWNTVAQYKKQMDERIEAKKANPTLEFPVSLLFIDEVNMFASMSAAYWREQDEKGTPPVWMDIAAVLWMGRFVHCHGILVGQRLDDKATGGVGLRDSLGFRGLAGYRPNQWKMLIGTTPIPKSQRQRGRWIYSDGQEETWVQNIMATPQEIRAYAMEGRLPVSGVVSGSVVSAGETPAARTDTGARWVTGLGTAAAYLGMSPAAFEKARQRSAVAGELRNGGQPTWTEYDLDTWARSRPRAMAKE